ncbi:MAG: Beta-glucosidase, partial [Marmoricola sp.]|nr:Beta-glucosidase [Marmoricola sp.]
VDALNFFDSALQYIWEPGEFIVHIGANSAELQSAAVQWRK